MTLSIELTGFLFLLDFQYSLSRDTLCILFYCVFAKKIKRMIPRLDHTKEGV